MPMRRNPRTGTHADLFFQGRTYMPGLAEGHTPVFVPVADLTRAELVKLERAAFSNAEWNALDEDVREEIYDNDSSSAYRIYRFIAPFVHAFEQQQNIENREFRDIEEGFEHWLRGTAHSHLMEENQPEIYAELMALGAAANIDEDAVAEQISEAMTDSNHYTVESDAGNGRVYSEEMRGYFWLDGDYLATHILDIWPWPGAVPVPGQGCAFPDELERALDKIRRDTNHTFDWDVADIVHASSSWRRGPSPGLKVDWETGESMSVYVNWEDVAQAVRDVLDESLPDDADLPGATPPAERVVFRWPDGFYVHDLLPSELGAEGRAMGMCVGRPDMGYGKAVRQGEIRILSVRRPSGKPLFTIEAELAPRRRVDEAQLIRKIEQVKGKANRLPGFDLGMEHSGQPLKRDEVQRLYELLMSPAFQKQTEPPPIDISHSIRDMGPAAEAVTSLYDDGDPWAVGLFDRLGIRPRTQQRRAVANPSAACGLHGSQCTGFCVPYRRRATGDGAR